ncbi:MAG: HD domain-containing phosphohydrolase [Myxococcota bacterium]
MGFSLPKLTKILIAGDGETARFFIENFKESGFEFHFADSYISAIQKLEDGLFQIIVANDTVDGMSGIQFLERCKTFAPDILRVLIVRYGDTRVLLEAINRGGIFKILTLPLDIKEVISALTDASVHYWTEKEHERLSNLIKEQNTELVVRTLNLDKEIHERTSSLLNGLVAALDLRDSDTRWHSKRVSLYSRRIAKALGIKGEELNQIERGALLHDIGKIGIKDAILLKPGRLTKEEWEEMKRHPEMGYRLLEGSDFLEHERIIVLHHQERYDGKGYPQGLKGKEIDIGARIFTIADTFDAMTSDRPYRKSLPFKIAREEIIRCSGTQFDPRIVEAFLSVPPQEWREIREKLEGRDFQQEMNSAPRPPPLITAIRPTSPDVDKGKG